MKSVTPTADLINSDPYLASFTLPPLAFTEREDADLILEPLWHALRAREYRRAVAYGRFALQDAPEAADAPTHAALLAGVAWAELRLRNVATARRLAAESLEKLPTQWMAHRVILDALCVEKKFTDAVAHAGTLLSLESSAPWDEPLTARDVMLAMAGWAWRKSDWISARSHLLAAYADALAALPAELMEDYFRLALYRNDAEDAAAAAALLIQKRTVESTDAVLQMLVQQGWTDLALPLYRDAFSEAPQSPVLRRRLVALYLKHGNVDEARSLANPAPLAVDIPARPRRSVQLTRR